MHEDELASFSVIVSSQEPFERALRRFSTKTKKTGILREIKSRRFYMKPSVKKKMDRLRSLRRLKKEKRLAQMTNAEKAKLAAKQKQRPGRR